jgi:hypothetical protein
MGYFRLLQEKIFTTSSDLLSIFGRQTANVGVKEQRSSQPIQLLHAVSVAYPKRKLVEDMKNVAPLSHSERETYEANI